MRHLWFTEMPERMPDAAHASTRISWIEVPPLMRARRRPLRTPHRQARRRSDVEGAPLVEESPQAPEEAVVDGESLLGWIAEKAGWVARLSARNRLHGGPPQPKE